MKAARIKEFVDHTLLKQNIPDDYVSYASPNPRRDVNKLKSLAGERPIFKMVSSDGMPFGERKTYSCYWVPSDVLKAFKEATP